MTSVGVAAGRRTPKLSRSRTLGLFYGFLGIMLAFRVAPALSDMPRKFSFGRGPDALGWTFNPQAVTVVIGLTLIVFAVLSFFEGRARRLVQGALIMGSVLGAVMILVASIALSQSSSTNVVPLLVQSLKLGSPIALGALAGMWSERSGVVNIGIEGMMLAGAGIGFVGYALLNGGRGGASLYVAVVIAILAGGLFAALHAVLSVSFRTDQVVSGVAVNLGAIGLTSFLRTQVLVPLNADSATTLSEFSIPLLSAIPIFGDELFVAKPIFFLTFVLFGASAFVLHRTRWGLRVRSVGENPYAAESLGINVIKIRYQAVILGGLIAGLAGAQFSLETVGSFDDQMTNGTGFIALAALVFGKWRPGSVLAAAMFFGFARALGVRIQLLGVEIGGFGLPSQFLQAVPYVVTLVVLAGAVGRAIPPGAVGRPYKRPQ